MSVAADSDPLGFAKEPPRGETQNIPPLESAGHMIAVALGLILLAEGGAFVLGFFAGLSGAILDRVAQAAPLCAPDSCGRAAQSTWRGLAGPAGALGAALVFLFSARVRGRTVGQGDRRAGLGDAAVARRWVIAALGIVTCAYGTLLSLAYYQARPNQLSEVLSTSPWRILITMTIIVVIAPVAEELFFRGWLWVGLRKYWGALPAAALTGVLWAAIHIEGGIWKPALLLPVAVVLSAARHLGQSVRAPIAIHVLYNLFATSPPWHLKWVGLI